MIIATIAHQEYQLASMADAEALLNIMNKATPICEQYTTGIPAAYIEDQRQRSSISIEITNKPLVTQAQYEEMVEKGTKTALKEVA